MEKVLEGLWAENRGPSCSLELGVGSKVVRGRPSCSEQAAGGFLLEQELP